MINRLIEFTQEKTSFLYENSLFLQNIDKLILLTILALFVFSTFASSDLLGFIALITIFLTLLQLLFKKGEKIEPKDFEVALFIYFMIVIISLAGSSLFMLSLKGFLKTLTYMGFYFSVAHYLKNNREKMPLIIGTIAICVGFEGILAFIQSFARPEAISTWQDTSKLNPEEIMTRVYGSLKPYNPNLLGGYFVAGIPAMFAFSALSFFNNKKKLTLITMCLSLLTCVSLFLTGCRGSYIALFFIFASIFAISAKFLWKNYKKIYLSLIGSAVTLGTIAILSITKLRSRIFSIFAMRNDSSNSFRFNVYQSSWQMFQDNILLGIGCGNQNFREIYGLYMRTGFDALSTYNVFLEIGVESGIFALLAFWGFLGLLAYRCIQFILRNTNAKSIIIAAMSIISITAVMIHGFVDTVFFRPQIQLIFWTMVAMASTVLKQEEIS